MRKIWVLATTVFLSIFLVTAIYAAPRHHKGPRETPKGVTNLIKVMQARIDRDKKMHTKQKVGETKRRKARQHK